MHAAACSTCAGSRETGWQKLSQLHVCSFLVESGVDVEATDASGAAPLHLAADARVAQLLLENKASATRATESKGALPVRCVLSRQR